MIVTASENHLPDLKSIWIKCFEDDRQYTDYIFGQLIDLSNVLIYTDGEDNPIAMMLIEPFELVTKLGDFRAAYIYGVATLPEHQGKGLSTALLDEAHVRLSEDGFSLSALVPASQSLTQFYGKRGYEPAFDIQMLELSGHQIPLGDSSCVLKSAKLEELSQLRDEVYKNCTMYAKWNTHYLKYIGSECKMLGGEVVAIYNEAETAKPTGYAVCYRSENHFVIKELAIAEKYVTSAIQSIHARFCLDKYTVYLPSDSLTELDGVKKLLPFAMVRWYDKEKQIQMQGLSGQTSWLTHALD